MAKPLKRHQSATEAHSARVGAIPDDIKSNHGMRKGASKVSAKVRVGHGHGRAARKGHKAKRHSRKR